MDSMLQRSSSTVSAATARAIRAALLRHARARPRAEGRADERVTILLGSAWGMGGTIRTVLNLAGYLGERRDVEILSVMRRREQPFFVLPPRVRAVALDDQRAGATPLRLRLLRRTLRTRRSVLMPPETKPFAECSLWTDVRLARRLRGRTGIVIGTHPCLNLFLAELRLPGAVTIGQEHMHLRMYRRRMRRQMAQGYPRLDALVVLTERDAAAYAELTASAVPVAVIPNTARSLVGGARAPVAPTVLAAGRLTPQKGFDLLIHAFAPVAAAHPDWRLRILGAGGQDGELRRLVQALGLTDVVELPGRSQQVGEEIGRAAVFVLSSRREGLPLVLLEAMSSGLPVVSFDCPTGPGEVIEHRRTGLLVPPRDVPALTRALLELIADAPLRDRLGQAAAAEAARYTIAALGPRWDQPFDDLRTRVA